MNRYPDSTQASQGRATVRALLTGTPVGDQAIWAVGWCLLIGVASYLWARVLYRRTPTRP